MLSKMNQVEYSIIDLWIKSVSVSVSLSLQENKKDIIYSLPLETLIDLINKLYYNKYKKLCKYKIITNNNKNTIQLYRNDFIDFFYKKQINSNWTYLKYKDYNIRWNCVIYLYQPNTKSYQSKTKKKIKSKTEIKDIASSSENNTKKKYKNNVNVKDFFDLVSDSE